MADFKKERMTKSSIKERIELNMEYMERKYEFEPDNGYLQVRGKGEEINRAYGKYDAFRMLVEALNDSNLNWIWNK